MYSHSGVGNAIAALSLQAVEELRSCIMKAVFLCFGKMGTSLKEVISRSNKQFELYCRSLSAILSYF